MTPTIGTVQVNTYHITNDKTEYVVSVWCLDRHMRGYWQHDWTFTDMTTAQHRANFLTRHPIVSEMFPHYNYIPVE